MNLSLPTSAVAPNPRMGLVRTKSTAPEVKLRKLLWAAGIRYRLHDRSLPGTPDIVIAQSRLVVFVNGCFWHCHSRCSKSSLPKTNAAFWKEKFKRNCERDKENYRKLRAEGWLVAVVWECHISRSPRIEAEKVIQLHGTVVHSRSKAQ